MKISVLIILSGVWESEMKREVGCLGCCIKFNKKSIKQTVKPFSLVVRWMKHFKHCFRNSFIWIENTENDLKSLTFRTVPKKRAHTHTPHKRHSFQNTFHSPNGHFQLWHLHQCEKERESCAMDKKKGKIHHITKCARGKYRRPFSFVVRFLLSFQAAMKWANGIIGICILSVLFTEVSEWMSMFFFSHQSSLVRVCECG